MNWLTALISTGGKLFGLISSFLNAKQRNADREAGRNEQRVKDLEAQAQVKDAMLDAAVNSPTPDNVIDRLRDGKF